METKNLSPGLRKRTPSSSPTGRSGKGEPHSPAKPPKPQSYGFRAVLTILITASVLAAISFRNKLNLVSTDLPQTYALCSPDGRILTVDETNPEVECLVVDGSNFSDIGSLSMDMFTCLSGY